MDEHVFLKEKGVTVTNARFITYGKTQVLAGITSVDCLVRTPSRFWPIILILIGLVLIFAVGSGLFMGLISAGLGIFWLAMQKSVYIVQLESASGKVDALESKDKEFIFRVVDALNNAIVARG